MPGDGLMGDEYVRCQQMSLMISKYFSPNDCDDQIYVGVPQGTQIGFICTRVMISGACHCILLKYHILKYVDNIFHQKHK